jgi:DNA helicase HerA-like ATPase
MSVKIDCQPTIVTEARLSGRCTNSILLGKVVDGGRPQLVRFDADENFVVLEVGKRGSGKSFGLGSALESFATSEKITTIGAHGDSRRGVLLLDPLDIHWTAIYPLRAGVVGPLKEQYDRFVQWGNGTTRLKVEPVNVTVFMPAGRRTDDDPQVFEDYYLPVSDLTPEDLALIYGANLVSDPAGMLIGELYDKVTRLGYVVNRISVAPISNIDLQSLLDCLQDDDIQANYAAQTQRAVRQRLLSWQRDPLFQRSTGTSITDLVRPGRLSILCMNRLSDDMRSVVTAVIVRKLKKERSRSSQMERRQAFDPEAAISSEGHVPRTILAIDEAQMILPVTGGGHARSAVESYVLEGRNFGLSMWLATQRPRGAISERAVSQVDTLIVHRLSTGEDLSAVMQLMQSKEPEPIRVNDRITNLAELIRSLDVGMALISADKCNVGRTFVAEMRPRVVAHGGRAF